jgi:pyrroline-5-carboxylate reductase
MTPTSIAVIGSGRMGETLIHGLLTSGLVPASGIRATDNRPERLRHIASTTGVVASASNADAAADAQLVLLCVKPQTADSVLAEIAPALRPGTLVVSIMAGKRLRHIESLLPVGTPVIRAMPNTPCQVSEGMTVLAGGTHAQATHLERAKQLFGAVGRVIFLSEHHFDAVTALSASGPAFIFIVIEALADGGVKCGLPRDVAFELAAQMTLGSAKMVIDSGQHPAVLKDDVTTPAGTTIDGILKLEEGGLRVTLIKAVTEAARRAAELG